MINETSSQTYILIITICSFLVCFCSNAILVSGQVTNGKKRGKTECSNQTNRIVNSAELVIYVTDENLECVKEVIAQGVNPNITVNGIYSTSPIFQAVAKNNLFIVETLLNAGVDLNGKEALGAFQIAISSRSREIINAFLKAGIDVNVDLGFGVTFLMNAVAKDEKEIVEMLIAAKASVNNFTNDGTTSLMLSLNNHKIIKMLLDAGAKIEATDENEQTALFYAVQNKFLDKISILLEKGANPNHRDNKCQTPLNIVEKLKDSVEKQKIIELLKKYGAK